MKYPHDPERLILVVDPLGTHNLYYEFNSKDVSYLEELPSISSVDGKIATMVRIWVKKMSVAVLSIPFLVGETRTDLPSPDRQAVP